MVQRRVAVIGGGPAGLMAAEVMAAAGVSVELYEAMPTAGRKFLMAGVGGMNLSHAEPFEAFCGRYRERSPRLRPLLQQFGAEALRAWAQGLGIETFVGSSGRVFPTDMKAAPLLRAWLRRLRGLGVEFHLRHRWRGWSPSGALCFDTPAGPVERRADAVVLALGGGSWGRLGSDGAWVPLLHARGVALAPLRPANCAFERDWSAHLLAQHEGAPLKSVAGRCGDGAWVPGELNITRTGVEGGLVYALSASLREELEANGRATLWLDLAPGRSAAQLQAALASPRGSRSMANHLRSRAGIQGVKASLLRELLPAEAFADPARLAAGIKSLPLPLRATRPLDEAISSAGGVRFEALDGQLMLRDLPGVFCAGEMLDWEAPTGGYLLTACFSTGVAAGQGGLDYLRRQVPG